MCINTFEAPRYLKPKISKDFTDMIPICQFMSMRLSVQVSSAFELVLGLGAPFIVCAGFRWQDTDSLGHLHSVTTEVAARNNVVRICNGPQVAEENGRAEMQHAPKSHDVP